MLPQEFTLIGALQNKVVGKSRHGKKESGIRSLRFSFFSGYFVHVRAGTMADTLASVTVWLPV
jgi:hypothetical protein